MWRCKDVTDEPSTLLPVEPKAMVLLCAQMPAVRMSTPRRKPQERERGTGHEHRVCLNEGVGRAHLPIDLIAALVEVMSMFMPPLWSHVALVRKTTPGEREVMMRVNEHQPSGEAGGSEKRVRSSYVPVVSDTSIWPVLFCCHELVPPSVTAALAKKAGGEARTRGDKPPRTGRLE